MQDGVEVHIEHRVQLFHGERIPVARILADGKAGSAVYADIDRAVVFEGGGEQLVPGLALGGIADNGDGLAAGGHYLGALFLDMGVNVAHHDFRALLAEELAGLAADAAVGAGDYSNFIEKTIHLYFLLISPYCGSLCSEAGFP